MKESIWGYLLIALGVVIIAVLLLVQRLTTTSEEEFYLTREVMKASMQEAVDMGTYMTTGNLVMSKEKFVEIFVRRFAESVTNDREYELNFYDIHEDPPKATVKVRTTTGPTSINNDSVDLDVDTYISGILEMSVEDDIANCKISIKEDGKKTSTKTLSFNINK